MAILQEHSSEPTHDPTVKRVLDTWAPRMLIQGVDYNDFKQTIDRVSTWDDWPTQWFRAAAMHENLAEVHNEAGNTISAGRAFFQAAITYHFAINTYVADHETYLRGHNKRVECYARGSGAWVAPSIRHEVPFRDYTMAGYLRTPHTVGPTGLVILVSGVDSTKEEQWTMEHGFLDRGLATFSFDGPGQGETWFHSGMIVEFESAVSAVIDYLEPMPTIDPTRIGLFGMSMGGYMAPRAAARDARVKACATSGGGYDRLYLGDAVRNADGFQAQRMRHLFKSTDDDVLVESLSKLTLESHARDITCPLLVVHGTRDHIPLEGAQRLVSEVAGESQLMVLDGGNHVCNNMPHHYRPAVWDFLRTHLGDRDTHR